MAKHKLDSIKANTPITPIKHAHCTSRLYFDEPLGGKFIFTGQQSYHAVFPTQRMQQFIANWAKFK